MNLDLTADSVTLTERLINIESVSRNEHAIAEAIEQALRTVGHLEVTRRGNTLVARTGFGRSERVVIAGHIDTVPLNNNLPARNDGLTLFGLGACDMKGGVGVALKLAGSLVEPSRDLTFVFYECEEIDSTQNGLGRLVRSDPMLLEADFAILMEPTNAVVEAGCQGTLEAEVRTRGERAHSARSWKGVNAIHLIAPALEQLSRYRPRRPVIEGLAYHEGLNAVFLSGGIAGNVVPDECVLTVNHRFAPDRSVADAVAFVDEFFDGFDVNVVDSAPSALPGLERPAARAFLAAVGGQAQPKFGWTDVARFTELGVPAVNYGPGDPLLAHTQNEYVPLHQIRRCEEQLRRWLS